MKGLRLYSALIASKSKPATGLNVSLPYMNYKANHVCSIKLEVFLVNASLCVKKLHSVQSAYD